MILIILLRSMIFMKFMTNKIICSIMLVIILALYIALTMFTFSLARFRKDTAILDFFFLSLILNLLFVVYLNSKRYIKLIYFFSINICIYFHHRFSIADFPLKNFYFCFVSFMSEFLSPNWLIPIIEILLVELFSKRNVDQYTINECQ